MNVSIAYEFIERDDLLVVVWDGLVSGADWTEFVDQRMVDNPNWPPGKRAIADILTVDPSSLSVTDVAAVTGVYRTLARNFTGKRIAIVAAAGWDIAVEYEQHIDRLGSTTIVFNQIESACGWLGVDARSTREVIRTLRAGLRHG